MFNNANLICTWSIAKRFLDEGASVIIADIAKPTKSLKGKMQYYELDVTNEIRIKKLMNRGENE